MQYDGFMATSNPGQHSINPWPMQFKVGSPWRHMMMLALMLDPASLGLILPSPLRPEKGAKWLWFAHPKVDFFSCSLQFSMHAAPTSFFLFCFHQGWITYACVGIRIRFYIAKEHGHGKSSRDTGPCHYGYPSRNRHGLERMQQAT